MDGVGWGRRLPFIDRLEVLDVALSLFHCLLVYLLSGLAKPYFLKNMFIISDYLNPMGGSRRKGDLCCSYDSGKVTSLHFV